MSQTDRYYPTRRFRRFGGWAGLVAGAALYAALYWLAGWSGVPQGHGSGSEIANGFAVFLLPMFALCGAFGGALTGEVIGLVVHFVSRR